jgi:hypothetical protein
MKKKKEPQKINVIYQFEEGGASKEDIEQLALDFAWLLLKWDKNSKEKI